MYPFLNKLIPSRQKILNIDGKMSEKNHLKAISLAYQILRDKYRHYLSPPYKIKTTEYLNPGL